MSAVVATQGQSGVHVSYYGQVSVSREVTLTAAELDDQGNFSLRVIRARTRQVVGRVSGVFPITGRGETSASTRYREDDSDEISLSKKICIWVCSLISGSLPVAMIVVGAVWIYNSTSKDSLLYTHAVGFSVLMWIVICIIGIRLCCCIYSWCCGGDDN